MYLNCKLCNNLLTLNNKNNRHTCQYCISPIYPNALSAYIIRVDEDNNFLSEELSIKNNDFAYIIYHNFVNMITTVDCINLISDEWCETLAFNLLADKSINDIITKYKTKLLFT